MSNRGSSREHSPKKHDDNSKFSKYSAERRVGKIKNLAEFTSFSDSEGVKDGFYKLDKDDGKDVVHREKGRSSDKGAWTVAITDIEKGNKKESTRDKVPYGENSLDKVFSEFKELKFGKYEGGKRRRSKSSKSSKKKSSKKGSKRKSKKGSKK